MKVSRATMSNLAYRILAELVDGDLGDSKPQPYVIEEAQALLHIKRCIAEDKKQIVFQLTGPDA